MLLSTPRRTGSIEHFRLERRAQGLLHLLPPPAQRLIELHDGDFRLAHAGDIAPDAGIPDVGIDAEAKAKGRVMSARKICTIFLLFRTASNMMSFR